MTLIKANNLTREYKKGGETIRPLNGLNLEVQRGDFPRSWAPAGAVKTTLLNLIAGIDSPTQGELIIDGINIATLGRNKLAAWRSEHVGYIFQLYNLVRSYRVRERGAPDASQLSRRERRSRVNEARTGRHRRPRGSLPRQMSGGQRVAIARALVTNPTIVVGDEPTGDLDKKSAKAIMELLQRINRRTGSHHHHGHARPQDHRLRRSRSTFESGSLVTDAKATNWSILPWKARSHENVSPTAHLQTGDAKPRPIAAHHQRYRHRDVPVHIHPGDADRRQRSDTQRRRH